MTDRRNLDSFAGCLLGGAVGDALGAPVEFMSLPEIQSRFGADGIRDLHPVYGRLGAITDDTQMTMFTAEGLILARNQDDANEIASATVTGVYQAYLRWLKTQRGGPPGQSSNRVDGWLLSLPDLWSARAPGRTCLSALSSGEMGTIGRSLNNSKGCGGVMRVAPVGFLSRDAFEIGCQTAAITHSHPSGYLAAGFLAATIAAIVSGAGLEQAVDYARTELRRYPDHQECLAAVDAALRLAEQSLPTPETVEQVGQGWIAEEALAIGLFCALTAGSFESGVILAANHGGDSDSTAAITGNILGALHGKAAIPSRWLDSLELRDEIEQLAIDLYACLGDPGGLSGQEIDWERYSGS